MLDKYVGMGRTQLLEEIARLTGERDAAREVAESLAFKGQLFNADGSISEEGARYYR